MEKGKHLPVSMNFLRLLTYSGVKFISLSKLFFAAPDH